MLGHDRNAGDGGDWDWDDERPRRRSRRRRSRWGLFTLVKLAVFLMPAALFLFGSLFADCQARPSFGDWALLLVATACARNEMMGSALAMPDNFAVLKRFID